eukprot:m.335722 g.335722  ORF g.335722 m.335722 type:complete len:464 (+) comp17661_c0_seq1:76-1467(+)
MEPTVVKQGWLSKRGEYIKNWRKRWFQLKSDGSFRGYKTGPPQPGDGPVNFFDVAGSVLTVVDDSKKSKKGEEKKYGFMIRFMQMTRFVERSFHCDTAEERTEWMEAYQKVQKDIMLLSQSRGQNSVNNTNTNGDASQEYKLTDFEMLKVLGKGTFGKVMLAKEKKTDEVWAVKILKKGVILERDEVAHTLTENEVLKNTKHPFLTGLKCSFQTSDLLVFVMEYVNGGELFFHLSKERKFSESRTRFYVAEISMAISYLHERGIIYRDLKLENLLLDSKGNIKITDFGLCKEDISFGATTTTFCGTPEYLAPEVLEDNDYGRAVDWWGVGVVMYEMVCGHLPFYDSNHEVLFEKILNDEIRLPELLSEACKDILSKLLNKDPRERLGGGERDGKDIMEHTFFSPIDFDKLYRLEVPAPFVPTILGKTDVSNFDKMFTSEDAKVTPPEGSTPVEAEFQNFEKVK